MHHRTHPPRALACRSAQSCFHMQVRYTRRCLSAPSLCDSSGNCYALLDRTGPDSHISFEWPWIRVSALALMLNSPYRSSVMPRRSYLLRLDCAGVRMPVLFEAAELPLVALCIGGNLVQGLVQGPERCWWAVRGRRGCKDALCVCTGAIDCGVPFLVQADLTACITRRSSACSLGLHARSDSSISIIKMWCVLVDLRYLSGFACFPESCHLPCHRVGM